MPRVIVGRSGRISRRVGLLQIRREPGTSRPGLEPPTPNPQRAPTTESLFTVEGSWLLQDAGQEPGHSWCPGFQRCRRAAGRSARASGPETAEVADLVLEVRVVQLRGLLGAGAHCVPHGLIPERLTLPAPSGTRCPPPRRALREQCRALPYIRHHAREEVALSPHQASSTHS